MHFSIQLGVYLHQENNKMTESRYHGWVILSRKGQERKHKKNTIESTQENPDAKRGIGIILNKIVKESVKRILFTFELDPTCQNCRQTAGHKSNSVT